MKKYDITRIIALPAALLLFAGCYQDIDLDKYKGENGENLLSLNSVVNPDSTLAAVATKTFFYSDPVQSRQYVRDLEISYKINGDITGILTFNPETNMYESSLIPSEGDVLELTTEYRGQHIDCRDTIPNKVKIESVDVSRQGPMSIYSEEDYLVTYQITFSDPVAEDNFYFLSYGEYDIFEGGNLHFGVRDYTYEYVFQQLARQINSIVPGWEPYSYTGLPFSDYGIDGQTHTLIVKEIIQGDQLNLPAFSKMKRRFKLFSISRAYYNYLLSRLYSNSAGDSSLHGGMIDLGFTEPLKSFSNINGGVGIFASYSLDETDIDVIGILGPFTK
ncbi:MAG: DUF4249 domain-containing protein [Paramuribaculum sp.]|nr:DUF4249 domain-containing protein [Paramuribaculum sp.]